MKRNINRHIRYMKKAVSYSIGILLFSCSILHAQNINTPNSNGPMGLQVNTLTGNLFFSRNEFMIPARGFDINIAFSYNSFNFDINNGYGNGWSFLYAIQYKNDTANSKAIIWGDGREDVYASAGGAGYTAPRGFFNTLSEYQSGKFLLTEPEGTKYYFDNATHKRITKMEEPNGNFMSFTYTDTLLTTLTNNAGQSISFSYDAKGRLTSVLDAITTPNRTWTYSYDEGNNLLQATDPLGGTRKYAYIVNGPMKAVTDKNNNVVDIIYYPDLTVSELIGCNKRQSFSYDSASQKSIVTDHLQDGQTQVTEYQYKRENEVSWLVGMKSNCCGFNMSFEYDENGNKIKETDANGNSTTYTYDSRGNVLTITDALNQTIRYTYATQLNRLTSVTDAKGSVTSFTYDAKGNLTQIREPGNLLYQASFNANGDIISSTDPKGSTYNYTYDAYGNPLLANGPNGYQATLGFDARGNLLAYTDAKGNSNSLNYDILSRLKTYTDPISNTIQIDYDAASNIKSVKNKNNESSLLQYDASNRLVQFKDAMGNMSFLSYDAMDNLTKITNALGASTSFSYDNRNRLNSLIDATGNETIWSYDDKGNVIQANLPNGQQYSYKYDVLDRITTIRDSKGIIAELAYDKSDNLISFKNGTGANTQLEYDSLNRIKKLLDPLGNSAVLAYDQNDNVSLFTDKNGKTSTFQYDNRNRVISMTDNNGSITTVQYDNIGNILSLKDANNNTTTYTYDNLDRVSRTTLPDGKYSEYTYDKKGNVTTTKLPDGTSVQFVYDTLNRLINRTLPDGNIYQYTYDAIGRIKTATNASGTVSLEYDALNRIISENYNSRLVEYTYDVAGRSQSTVYPDGTIVAKDYDTRNRLINIRKNGTVVASYLYNDADQVISQTLANGVITNYEYDFANRLININTGNGSIQQTNFTYDKNQNKLAINRLNAPTKSEQFVYDNGNRLTNYTRGVSGGPSNVVNSYTYDALGNRTAANLNGTNIVYTPNNLNQLANSNNGSQNINFTYNALGQLSFDGKYYKTYDAEGRLLKDSSSPSNVLTYLYDAFGRRVQKKMNSNIQNNTYAGLELIEERDAANQVKNKTIFNNFLIPVENENNGSVFYYHQNELNSVEAISNAQGRVVEKYEYDVYGKQSITDSLNNALAGSLTGNHFGFTGQIYDSATGMNKFYFREYNPQTGLFNQRDPLDYDDGMGMYQYVHNNPANGVDILGLEDCVEKSTARETISKVDGIESILNGTYSWLAIPLEYSLKQTGAEYFKQLEMIKELGRKTTALKMLDKMIDNNIANGLYKTANKLAQSANTISAEIKALNAGIQKIDQAAKMASPAASTLNGVKKFGKGFNVLDIGIKTVLAAGDLANYISGTGDGYQLTKSTGNLGQSALNFLGPVGAGYNLADFTQSLVTGKSMNDWAEDYGNTFGANSVDQKMDEELMEYHRKNGTIKKFLQSHNRVNIRELRKRKPNCPQNNSGGSQRQNRYRYNPVTGELEVISALDPNEIIGPAGEPTKRWVSVKDRLPYTVTYENDKSATAPAKFVKVVAPIHANMDAASFQLGNFGFNNLTFTIPGNTASYYQRLDCRDSLGLYVDITAGYDVQNNQAFWQLQSIDPITLLPPADPLKGLLLLQDSLQPNNGHGFVNFSIKPRPAAQTLDTIGARADIIFDANEVIATNVETNTIDAYAPISHLTNLPPTSPINIALSWSGQDDVNGCGLKFYSLYVSDDGVNFSMIRSGITRTDTTITGKPGSQFFFFVLATDSVGNTEILRQGEIKSTFVTAALPISWLYFKGATQQKNNVLNWSTANEQNSKEFRIERSFNGASFSSIGTVAANGNTSSPSSYQFIDYHIDKLNSKVMFYRLKQIDKDNKFNYSSVIRLTYNQEEKSKTIVYPNPTPGTIHVTIGDKKLIGSMAIVVDQNGRVIQNIKITAENQAINLSSYSNGIYYIKLSNKEILKVIKN
ncbi:MAG: T9SS type A sorting domain-containing protein [Chitinophagaceae bacterium]|nr:T9SS type A sorting domain-containing protein [Chitinophagaceae bacterium]